MLLPDLPPDFAFRLLTASDGDRSFAFEAKRSAMGPHITARWGWDETVQREIHARHYAAKPFFGIERAGERLGVLSFRIDGDHVRFGEFYLFQAFHRRGVGTAVLRHCLETADRYGLPMRLEHLLWNPVGSLYRRHGFLEIGRSDIHIFMERPVRREKAFPAPTQT